MGDHPSCDAFFLSWSPTGKILHKVKCNGFAMNVGSNLYEAPLQIANIPEQKFWADLIYINQDDDAEKVELVALVGNVFGQARNVLIWLG